MKLLSSGDVELEGLVNRGGRWMSRAGNLGGPSGDGDKTGTCVVMCHPHPYLGGNMRNPLMTHLARRLAAAGITAVRFNFRGVGFSGGKRTWARVAERDDACAAVRHAARLPWIDPTRVFLFGYSFGSAVALAALDEVGDECAGFAGCAHPWGVRAMLVPGQPPCASAKPKLFFHAVDDVVVGAKFTGTRGGSTGRNPELARLRQPRRALALKRDHSFAGGYVNVCEILVDWLDNPRSVGSGHPSSSSDEGGSRQVRGSDSPESFSSEGSGGVGGGGSRGQKYNHRRSARGDGQRLGRGTARTSPGSGPTPRPRCRSTRKASGRASRRASGDCVAGRGQSLRSSLSTGSGGSGLSTGTGSDVSLDSQGRPRHRVGPRARHVPGDARPTTGFTAESFPMPGDRTRITDTRSTIRRWSRGEHVLPVGDHAVQEYMRARLRHHRSSEMTDTEGSSAVDDEFGGGMRGRLSRVGVWSVDGAPRWFAPISPHRDRDARYRHRTPPTCTAGAESSSWLLAAAAAAEGPRPRRQNSLFGRFWRRRAAGRVAERAKPAPQGCPREGGDHGRVQARQEQVNQIPRADASSGNEVDAPVGQPSKFADNQRSITEARELRGQEDGPPERRRRRPTRRMPRTGPRCSRFSGARLETRSGAPPPPS